jgi:hypothetical protein
VEDDDPHEDGEPPEDVVEGVVAVLDSAPDGFFSAPFSDSAAFLRASDG